MRLEDNVKIYPSSQKKKISIIVLFLTTILWGTSFIITKTLIETIPSMFYMGIRFLIGGIAFLPFLNYFDGFDIQTLKISFIAGFIYFIAIATQTLGMFYGVSASNAGFLTGLNVIMVPLFLAIFFKEKVSKKIWIAVILAIIGIYILNFNEGLFTFYIEDYLIVICAIFCALYIIYLGKNIDKINYIFFSMLQLFIVSVFSFIISVFTENWYIIFGSRNMEIFSISNILLLIYMGVIVTSLTFVFQAFGQKHVSSNITAIIFALEPVFATFFAIILGDDMLTLYSITGSVLILVGILISIERNKK